MGALTYRICTDTCADLPLRTARQLEIAHLSYTMGGTDYHYDFGRETDLSAFYGALREGERPRANPVSPEAFFALWKPLLDAGLDVLYLGVSSRLSSTFEAARTARAALLQAYPHRRILLADTRCCSIAQGMLVFEAVQMKLDGADIDAVANWVLSNRAGIRSVVLPENVKHLREARLLPAGAGIFSRFTLLSLDESGAFINTGGFKTQSEALDAMAGEIAAQGHALREQTVGIVHADALPAAQELALLLKPHCAGTVVFPLGPIVGAYAGPGAVGAAFFGG